MNYVNYRSRQCFFHGEHVSVGWVLLPRAHCRPPGWFRPGIIQTLLFLNPFWRSLGPPGPAVLPGLFGEPHGLHEDSGSPPNEQRSFPGVNDRSEKNYHQPGQHDRSPAKQGLKKHVTRGQEARYTGQDRSGGCQRLRLDCSQPILRVSEPGDFAGEENSRRGLKQLGNLLHFGETPGVLRTRESSHSLTVSSSSRCA
jgi:hypothetical protein